ncbi:transposase domain protein [Ochrobactrum quorumnocens]|uniref:Transposase domain protein n=1 Tax=Ochrobactrum quorumnocens TaxID=271865 RepID=A0A248UBT9_9HYPH|nr:transposase domain protein [[Ochrobactrum] quorumnocens]ASV84522.1 transposase domain protein [[Ochrobactrum] quorumnocens]ASV87626.1 transposase domain protein [[Ochrobactrum] quorumnocens]KRC03263.1 hypothetical protein ASE23_29130 [Rhizobium sp. Root73]
MPVEEPPERADPGPYATLSQPHFDFGKGDIRRRLVKRKDRGGMGVDVFRTTVAALLVGLNGSGVAELLLPANSTGGAHTKPLSRLSAGHTGGNRIHNALAKIE